jgi:sec-independent protein translocase protein TatC
MARQQPDQMPFLDHLEELRFRLFWIIGALLIGVMVSFWLVLKFKLLLILQRPILPYLSGSPLVVTNPGDGFGVLISTSLIFGVILALPVVLYHVWAFLSPGLYSHEKKLVVPVLIGATLLFMAGVALSFFVVLPLTLKFLMQVTADAFQPMITAAGYFNFAITMSLAFGAVFELPILIVALTALGIVTPAMLVKFRRFAFVGCLLTSAFITPGSDILSLCAMAVPLYLLYELSVILSAFVYRRQQRRRAAAAADENTIGVPA